MCQHKDFCCNMLSLNAGLQDPLGMSLCFLSSGFSFILSCVPQESLGYPQVSPSMEAFPFLCLWEHLSVSTQFFSPRTLCLLPLWWPLSLTHASAGVPWAAVLVMLVYLSHCWSWLQLVGSNSWPPPSWVTPQLSTTQTMLVLPNITVIHFTYQNISIKCFLEW